MDPTPTVREKVLTLKALIFYKDHQAKLALAIESPELAARYAHSVEELDDLIERFAETPVRTSNGLFA